MRDELLEQLVTEARADPNTVGLLLQGSRAAGSARPDADYDLVWVVTDESRDSRPSQEQRGKADIVYSCPSKLASLAGKPGWWMSGLAYAEVLLDKTGEVARLVDALAVLPDAAKEAEEGYDGYVHGFIRSVGAWKRGDELGARLHACDSLRYLARALFALEGRWSPYLDRLGGRLGEFEEAFGEIARTADLAAQQELEARVAALMAERGVPLEEWGEKLEDARRLRL